MELALLHYSLSPRAGTHALNLKHSRYPKLRHARTCATMSIAICYLAG